jgi:hypothetical protein
MAMDNDREWNRIEQELRRQPAVNRAAIARIMTEIHRAPRRSWLARAWDWMAEPKLTLSPITALATMGIVVAAAVGIARLDSGSAVVPGSESAVANGGQVTRVLPVSTGAQRQDVQFVLVADSATDVRIVGDFNDWDARATPLRRSGSGGVWSVVVPLAPGRHVYAFVIDGKQWIADAAAPQAPENEFGTPKSIIMVGGSS